MVIELLQIILRNEPEAEHAVSNVSDGPFNPSANDTPLESTYLLFLGIKV